MTTILRVLKYSLWNSNNIIGLMYIRYLENQVCFKLFIYFFPQMCARVVCVCVCVPSCLMDTWLSEGEGKKKKPGKVDGNIPSFEKKKPKTNQDKFLTSSLKNQVRYQRLRDHLISFSNGVVHKYLTMKKHFFLHTSITESLVLVLIHVYTYVYVRASKDFYFPKCLAIKSSLCQSPSLKQ